MDPSHNKINKNTKKINEFAKGLNEETFNFYKT